MYKKKRDVIGFIYEKDWITMLVLSVLGISLIHQALEKQKQRIGLDAVVIEVLIADRTIEQGSAFKEEDLRIEVMPEKYVPIGALYPSDAPKFAGQRVARTIHEGEMILSSALDIEFALDNASSKIEDGYRALSIPVDEISSVSYNIEAGDHIDLLTTVDDARGQNTTMTILQNVTVLSTGTQEDRDYGSITLMVLPSEAPLIIHTLQSHGISIILRNPYDPKTRKDLPMISKQDIIQAGFLNHLQSERDQRINILRGQTQP
ncbi:MAG: Flp pilus assembly protein CpaB [Bdellovibrionota bacterium]